MGFFQDYRLNSFSLGRSRQLNTIPGQFRGIGGTRMMGSTYINFNNYNMGGTRGFYGYDYGCQEKGGFWNTFANWTMGAGILGNMFGGIFQSIGLAGGADGKGGVDKTKEKKTTTTTDFPNEAQKAVLDNKGWEVIDNKDGSYTIKKSLGNDKFDVRELTPELYKKLVSSELEIPEVKAQKKIEEKPEATDNTELINNALGDSKTIKNSFSDMNYIDPKKQTIGDKNTSIKENGSDKVYDSIPEEITINSDKGSFTFKRKQNYNKIIGGVEYPLYELNKYEGNGSYTLYDEYVLKNGELVQPNKNDYKNGEQPYLKGSGTAGYRDPIQYTTSNNARERATDVTAPTPVTDSFPKVTVKRGVANTLIVEHNGEQVRLTNVVVGGGYTGIIKGKKYHFDEDGKITRLVSEQVGTYKTIKVEKIYDDQTKDDVVHYRSSNGTEWLAKYTPGESMPIKIKLGNENWRIVKDDHISKNNKYFKVDKYGTRISGPKDRKYNNYDGKEYVDGSRYT